MDITWLGENSFKINDEIINIIVNPSNKTIDPSTFTEETVLVFTDADNKYDTKHTKVDSPGEYEIHNASIHGVANSVVKDDSRSISTCYRIESRGISIAVIGTIGSPFDSEALSVLASSHIVLISPENKNIDSEILANTIRSVEPRKIIISGFDKNSKTPSKSLDTVIKVLGLKDYEPRNKASISMSSFGDSQEIIILEN
ncbi:MBL fold metallo-hydrolase [Chloroflexi bacterium]|nr:MBL fold metallo-hydrolase [Chloroflexota bacterium]